MTIELSPDLADFIEEQVKTGIYESPSAAVNAAVARMLAEQSPEEVAELRALVEEGIADLDAGRVVTNFNLKDFLSEQRREFNAKQGK
jgi:putative addiction module CopG family antidote